MQSHLTAFGVGAGLSLLAAGAFALIAPEIIYKDRDGEGVHIVNIGNGENGSFHLKDGTLDLAAEWKGGFSFAADGRTLAALKGTLKIESKDKGVTRKAVFASKDGKVSAKVYADDKLQEDGAKAGQEAGDLLQLFARSSGVKSEDRVKAILAASGKRGVIDEIGQLVGSHAIGAYVEALAAASQLTSEDVNVITQRVGSIDSDYAKRKAVSALLGVQDLDDASTAEIIAVAKTIEGDHELRLIIEELAEKEMSLGKFSLATALIDEIEGDHEVRLAIAAVLESKKVDNAIAAEALDLAAKTIEGDYELRLAIEAAGGRVNDGEVGSAALNAVRSIDSPHDRRLAIESFASAVEGPSPHWVPLIEAAAMIDGDLDRRLAIEALRSQAPETDDIQVALKRAAESIESEHDRRLALEALE